MKLTASPAGAILEMGAEMIIMKYTHIATALLISTLAVGCAGNDGTGQDSAEDATAEQGASHEGADTTTRPEPTRPTAPAPPRFRTVSAPAATELPLELTTALSTETAEVESPVSARLRQPVVVDGITVVPAGAIFRGTVTEVERAGRVRGRARLALRFTDVTIDDQRDPVRTEVVSFEGEATKSEDATKVGAGAGIGAVIGGIVGGGKGAAKGAAIGGTAGAGAVLATRGRDVELPVGSQVTARLASPFEIRVEVR